MCFIICSCRKVDISQHSCSRAVPITYKKGHCVVPANYVHIQNICYDTLNPKETNKEWITKNITNHITIHLEPIIIISLDKFCGILLFHTLLLLFFGCQHKPTKIVCHLIYLLFGRKNKCNYMHPAQ